MAALLVFSGCATTVPGQTPTVTAYYEKDLRVCVNGDCFDGVGVAKPAVKYEMEVQARGSNDFLLFETCSRWKKFEDESKRVKYTYVPMDELENSGECVMDITSLVSSSKKNAWARIAFPDTAGKFSLRAYLRCNGMEGQTEHGVSICQSATGLMQQINFSEPVFTSRVGKCVMPPSPDGKKFNFKIQKADCMYKFKVQGEDLWHILYTVGFEESLYRGD